MVRHRTLVPFALATFIVTCGASGVADDSKEDDGSKTVIGRGLRPRVPDQVEREHGRGVRGYASLSPAVGSSDGGFTYDVGGFLDLTLIPLIDIGVHGGYNHLSVEDRGGGSYAFGTVGLDVALKF